MVSEFLATEGWNLGHVEGEVGAGEFTGPNLGGCGFDAGWGQEVEAADVVVLAPEPGGVFGGAGDRGEVLYRGERS